MAEPNRLLTRLHEEAAARRAADVSRNDPVPASGAIDLASNDYLGLARHPAVVAAACAAVNTYGASARASRLVTGTTELHHELEAALAEFTGACSALVFSSGYTANLAAVTTVASSPQTLIVSDAHNHASLIDACRLARGRTQVVAHNDLAAVEQALATRTEPEAVVVTESVFSVLGDHSDIGGLLELCRRYDALLLIDEAHGLGVHGAGRGLVAGTLGAIGADDRVLVTATLSKALGAQGGVVLGPAVIRQALLDTGRSFIFDTGLAPAAVAGAHAALDLLAGGQVDPDRIFVLAGELARVCRVPDPASAVVQVPMPSPAAAVATRQELAAAGLLVGCFRPPSVPDGISRLRLTCRADLDETDLHFVAKTLKSVGFGV